MVAAIAKALHEVMSKVGYVQKTGRNDFHKYSYAGEADLLDKIRPAMVEAGLLLIPSGKSVSDVDQHGNVSVSVEYTLVHKDGEVWPEKIVAFGCGNDKARNGSVGDKGVYKALTGANKYLLFKLFQIETGDDPEADEREKPAPEAKQAEAREAVDEKHIISGLVAAAKMSRSLKELDDWKATPSVKATFDKLSRDGKMEARAAVQDVRDGFEAAEMFAA